MEDEEDEENFDDENRSHGAIGLTVKDKVGDKGDRRENEKQGGEEVEEPTKVEEAACGGEDDGVEERGSKDTGKEESRR